MSRWYTPVGKPWHRNYGDVFEDNPRISPEAHIAAQVRAEIRAEEEMKARVRNRLWKARQRREERAQGGEGAGVDHQVEAEERPEGDGEEA